MSAHKQFSFACISVLSLCLALSSAAQDIADPPETTCLWISVIDPINRMVTGLEKESFSVYEENTKQTITRFRQKAVPLALGIVWDVSRSINGGENFAGASALVSFLLRERRTEDEYFFVNFSEQDPIQTLSGPKLPTDAKKIQIDKSKMRLSLFDAVYLGLDGVNQSRRDKRALIIISDGAETYGQHKASEIRKYAQESDVQIYAVVKQGYFVDVIRSIVELTGGIVFFPSHLHLHISSPSDLKYYVDRASAHLLNQYQLCYAPTNNKHDGTLRKIKVELDVSPKLPKLIVRTRKERQAQRGGLVP